MGVELRLFDEQRDLLAVVNLYNDAFAPLRPIYSWPMSVERFRDRVLEHEEYRREGFWVATEGQRLVGFVLANTRLTPLNDLDAVALKTPHAFISVVAVQARWRRQGIGTALCRKAEEFARGHHCVDITAGCNPSAPMAFFIALQSNWLEAQTFLNACGFDMGEVDQSMVRSILGFSPDEATAARIAQLRSEGYECRPYEQRDYPGLLGMLKGGWPYWDLDMLSKAGKWTRTRPFMETCFMDCSTEEIPGPDEIAVVVKDGKMLSFCAQTISRSKQVAYLGPMLTVPEARNLGLGTVSLQVSLEIAARKGAILCDLWTGSDAHRTRFYGKSGFRAVMRWPSFVRKLTSPG